jgi:pimeloyl-ACP methyl ester carboxylesterase
VRGRYYKSPAGTPFYPGVHNLGSRTWNDSNWDHVQALGESLSATHQWDDGRAPVNPPNAVRLGAASCIANGETLASGIPSTAWPGGFPLACYSVASDADQVWFRASRIEECPIQRFYAQLLIYQYDNNLSAMDALVGQQLGTGFTRVYLPETDLFPSIYILFTSSWLICITDGTRNFQQIALQGWQTLRAPENFGILATARLWYHAAQYVYGNLKRAGVPFGVKTLFVGHSYGAAVASILAAMLRWANPRQELLLLTFGIPKPGDRDFVALLDQCRQVHIQDIDDIVCTIPPDESIRFALIPIVGPAVFGLWQGWERTSLPFRLTPDGQVFREYAATPDLLTMAALVQDAIAHIALPSISGHYMTTYLARLQIRCPALLPSGFVMSLTSFMVELNTVLLDSIDAAEVNPLELVGDIALPAGVITLDSLEDLPAGVVKLDSLEDLPAGVVKLDSLAEIPAGVITLDSLAELPAGVVKLDSLAELPAGVVKLDSLAELPAGAIALTSESEFPLGLLLLASPALPGPGSTCASAGGMSLGAPQTWTNAGAFAIDWWKIAVVSGSHYTVTLTIVSGGPIAGSVMQGTCPSPTFLGPISPPSYTYGFTAGSSGTMYVSVGPAISATTYTIETTSP